MNTLNEIHSEAQTATNAILTGLSDGCARSAKQIYERSEVLESRKDANKFLWELRRRGYVESSPATGDISDPAARLVWAITEAGRACLAGDASEPAAGDDTPPVPPVSKPVATVTVPATASSGCQCGGTCGRPSINPSGAKYLREINLVDGKADVYAVLVAFGVTCPARQHAIKKLLCAGLRGKGNESQDLAEARDAVERAIQIQRAR